MDDQLQEISVEPNTGLGDHQHALQNSGFHGGPSTKYACGRETGINNLCIRPPSFHWNPKVYGSTCSQGPMAFPAHTVVVPGGLVPDHTRSWATHITVQCTPDISWLVGSKQWYRDISGSAIYRATVLSQNQAPFSHAL